MCFRCRKKGHLSAVCESSQAAVGAEEDLDVDAAALASESSVSFTFGTEQDFRLGKKKNVNS